MLKWFLGGLLAVVLAIVALIYHRPIIDFMSPPEDVKSENVPLVDSERYNLEFKMSDAVEYAVEVRHLEGVPVTAIFRSSTGTAATAFHDRGLPLTGAKQTGLLMQSDWIPSYPGETMILSLQADKTTTEADDLYDTALVKVLIRRRSVRPEWLSSILSPIEAAIATKNEVEKLEELFVEEGLEQLPTILATQIADLLEQSDQILARYPDLARANDVGTALQKYSDLATESEIKSHVLKIEQLLEPADTGINRDDTGQLMEISNDISVLRSGLIDLSAAIVDANIETQN